MNVTLGIDDVQVIDRLYPRSRPIELKIEEYRDNVEKAPRITVARGCVLVDGFHRWQAHKRNGATTIEVIDLGDLSDDEILAEAARLNSRHGTSLTMEEKRVLAVHLTKPNGTLTQAETASTLSVSLRTVEGWLAKYDAEMRAARRAEGDAKRKQQIADAERMRAEGMTQQAIGEALGVDQKTVSRWFRQGRKSAALPTCDEPQQSDWGYAPESTNVDDDATPPADDPDPEPEPLADETRQYLDDWSEDGDLVDAVRDGLMTVAEAVKHAKTAQALHQNSDKHSPFKAHGQANQSLQNACNLISNFLSVPAVALDAQDPQLWRLLRILTPQAIERLEEWKEAADARMG